MKSVDTLPSHYIATLNNNCMFLKWFISIRSFLVCVTFRNYFRVPEEDKLLQRVRD